MAPTNTGASWNPVRIRNSRATVTGVRIPHYPIHCIKAVKKWGAYVGSPILDLPLLVTRTPVLPVMRDQGSSAKGDRREKAADHYRGPLFIRQTTHPRRENMKHITIAALSILLAGGSAHASVITFESVALPGAGYLNGSEGGGGYIINQIDFNNNYDVMFGSWSGFSISNHTDNTSQGFTNQYSSITGGGFGGSSNYAVGYYSTYEPITTHVYFDPINLTGLGAYFTNTTWAALDMRNGGAFGSKKFGGLTGNDADWFKLTIAGFAGLIPTGMVEFYLADFRSANNAEDYIVEDWRYVDFTSLGSPDRLEMSLSSSDVGMFGINTPTYFAMDNFLAVPEPSSLCILLTGLGLLLRRKR
jgi:hypothetical protein